MRKIKARSAGRARSRGHNSKTKNQSNEKIFVGLSSIKSNKSGRSVKAVTTPIKRSLTPNLDKRAGYKHCLNDDHCKLIRHPLDTQTNKNKEESWSQLNNKLNNL